MAVSPSRRRFPYCKDPSLPTTRAPFHVCATNLGVDIRIWCDPRDVIISARRVYMYKHCIEKYEVCNMHLQTAGLATAVERRCLNLQVSGSTVLPGPKSRSSGSSFSSRLDASCKGFTRRSGSDSLQTFVGPMDTKEARSLADTGCSSSSSTMQLNELQYDTKMIIHLCYTQGQE